MTATSHAPAVQPRILEMLGFSSCTCGEQFPSRKALLAHFKNHEMNEQDIAQQVSAFITKLK